MEINNDTVSVMTDDKIFHYLNEGTSVRKAIMTPDFVPKTKAGSLRSGPGRGGKAFVTRNPRLWKPGQEAREWTRLLLEKYQQEDTFRSRLDNLFRDVLKRIFG